MTTAVDLTAIAAADERRRERILILRECRPLERQFLRGLAESRYEPYGAGERLGISSRTIWKMLKRPRVKRAMELFLQDALDQIGVSHASLVADLVEIKRRCMQAQPVLDDEGKPTGTYTFNARAAIAAINEIAELVKLAPAKRVELTGANGGPIETVTRITDDMDANESARVYQELVQTH